MHITNDQITVLITLVVALYLFLSQIIRNDLTAILIVLTLAIFEILSPEEAFSGFSSEPAIVIAGMFVLGEAFRLTGISDAMGQFINKITGKSYAAILGVSMPLVAFFSSFTHHVTTTAIMVPILLSLSKKRQIAPSKLLMPIAFAASLGTTMTIIAAPAFLVANSVLRQAGVETLGIFSITPIGIALTIAGTIYCLTIGRFLLPNTTGNDPHSEKFHLSDYFTEVVVLEGSPFIGKTASDLENEKEFNLNVVTLLRSGRKRSINNTLLEAGDLLLIRTTPEDLLNIRKHSGLELHPLHKYEEASSSPKTDELDQDIVQAVVSPSSDLIGKTIGNVDFLERFGVIVVGLWRQQGWVKDKLSKLIIEPGDVLVLVGDDSSIINLSNESAFLMLVPFQGETKLKKKGKLAILIMLSTILAAGTHLVEIPVAIITGATLAVLTGCLTAKQAYKAIDAKIFVFIAGAIPLGLAMEKTGVATMLAEIMKNWLGHMPPFAILFVLFSLVAVLTQFMSDAATTALFAPVAAGLAVALNHSPYAYVITVAMAAVVAFLTPIGHHGNLLIYAPGGYKFSDFIKVGTPLTLLLGIIVVSISLLLWPV